MHLTRCPRHHCGLVLSPFAINLLTGTQVLKPPRVCLACIDEAREKVRVERWRDRAAPKLADRPSADWFKHWPRYSATNNAGSHATS